MRQVSGKAFSGKFVWVFLLSGLLVAAMLGWTSCGGGSSTPTLKVTQAGQAAPVAGVEFVAGELLVGFYPGAASTAKSNVRAGLGASTLKEFSQINVQLWGLPPGLTVQQAINRLSANPNVDFAEPNYIYHLDDFPNDPMRNDLYGMHNLGQTGGTADADIDALEAWEVQTGSADIVVGVIDTGIDYNHEDLSANIWTNPGEIPDNGIDDDGNGYIDDVHGWDFINGDNDPMDDVYHGSHVSGTIGGVGNNGTGVTGVNWTVTLMALKVFNLSGGATTDDLIEAIVYATTMGVPITSNSWGGGGKSRSMENAIANSGALFVASAGNRGGSRKQYPAAYGLDNIIAVAATDHDDALARFSSYGSSWVDLGAPGVDVLSSTPNNSYSLVSGTSMACPHVSGAVALVMAQFPSMDNAAVKAQILNTVDPLDSLAGKTLTGGRLNLARAVGGTPDPPDGTAPGAVTNLAASVNGLAATLTWTAAGDNGTTGQAYLYDVRYLEDTSITEANWDSATAASGEPLPQSAGSMETFIVDGLSADTTYYLALKTVDEAGNNSDLSNVVTATTGALPPGSWVIEVVSEIGFLTHSKLGLAYDPNDGNPSVVYDDNSSGIRFAHWNGSSWDKESIEQVSALKDLVYDPREPNTDRNPTLTDYAGGTIRFIRWDQSSQTWDIEDAVDGSWHSMAYNPTNNYPSISYAVKSGKGKKAKSFLRLARFDGSSWISEDVSPEWPKDTSLAYDSAGNPAIAYEGGLSDGRNAVKCARWTGSAWQIDVVHSSTTYVNFISLAHDPTTSYPSIAFFNGEDLALKFSNWNGSSWDTVVVDNNGLYVGEGASLAYGSSGIPYISYHERGLDEVRFASWNGVSWDIEVVHSGIYLGPGGITSLKIDPNGNPAMVYSAHTGSHSSNPNEPVYFARKILGP